MGCDKELIKQDVRAIEHATTDDTAMDAALLLRNDISTCRTMRERRLALDLVHRTNVYDRSENPDLPKISLISDRDFPQYKVGTKLEYRNGKTVLEGDPDR